MMTELTLQELQVNKVRFDFTSVLSYSAELTYICHRMMNKSVIPLGITFVSFYYISLKLLDEVSNVQQVFSSLFNTTFSSNVDIKQ